MQDRKHSLHRQIHPECYRIRRIFSVKILPSLYRNTGFFKVLVFNILSDRNDQCLAWNEYVRSACRTYTCTTVFDLTDHLWCNVDSFYVTVFICFDAGRSHQESVLRFLLQQHLQSLPEGQSYLPPATVNDADFFSTQTFFAVRTASIDTLPPPITATSCPVRSGFWFFSYITKELNSRRTPSECSPSITKFLIGTCTDCNKYCVVFFTQALDCHISSDTFAKFNFDTRSQGWH